MEEDFLCVHSPKEKVEEAERWKECKILLFSGLVSVLETWKKLPSASLGVEDVSSVQQTWGRVQAGLKRR